MSVEQSTPAPDALLIARQSEAPGRGSPAVAETIPAITVRVRAEYGEMPGMRLTVRQAARLFDISPDVAEVVLDGLRQASVLTRSHRGTYSLVR